MNLTRYHQIRDFAQTPEPDGKQVRARKSPKLRFVIQKHDATRLHFDLRLEYHGVFKSWAVTRGPSLDPHDKRLAVEVEDHPLEYGDFEGTIPKGQYGGGTVQLWDRGYWAPEPGCANIGKSLQAGELKFVMEGERLHGGWVLIRLRHDEGAKRINWLLIKHRDNAALDGNGGALAAEDRSVASGRSMAQIAAAEGAAATPFITAPSAQAMTMPQVRPRVPATKERGWAEPKPRPDLPRFIEPQLCKSVDRPPGGPGWAHEIKFDGYRMQLRTQGGRTTLLTRKGLDWSDRFVSIVHAGAHLPDGIVDGEIVALDHTGAPNFATLQAALSAHDTGDLIYFAFDLLFDDMQDLRTAPLAERKARLHAHLARAATNIRYVEHFLGAGDAVLRSACRMDMEGIVSKKLDAPYRSGRGDAWTKSKCRRGHEVVIAGWTTTCEAFRSLIAGVYHDGALVHVGRIGTGFTRATVDLLLPKLRALEISRTPFNDARAPKKSPGTHWVRPELVAEIECAGFTGDGALRQAAFKGLRTDKPAADVDAEPPTTPNETVLATLSATETRTPRGSVPVMGITISHAGKALWPDANDAAPVTKLDLARYYEAVGAWMLRHIKGRPCSIIRMPDGIAGAHFFQRHAVRGSSSLFTEIRLSGDHKPYLQLDTIEALIAAAQSGAVELHPWNCEPFKPEQPGRLIFDLDPAPDIDFNDVVSAAHDVRDRLDQLGLISFCKTTGGKGLHIVTPVTADGIGWPAAKSFARDVCKAMAADAPARFLINMATKQRTGRIYLDYLRNDRLATAVAPLSPRGRDGAPVSMPLTWRQVRKGLKPGDYTLRTVPPLVAKLTAWEDYFAAERPLATAMRRLGKV